MTFNPKNWYWIVANSTTQVYSSAIGDYVPANNTTYVAWKAIPGNNPTSIDTEANLGDVLAPYSLRPIATAVFDGYADSQANKLTLEIAAKLLFNHENRIRTLAGTTTVTAAQFKAFIKGLI